MVRKRKAAVAFLCFLLAAVLLAGCVTTHNEDTLKKKSAYLRYSMGKYTAAREKHVRSNAPIPHADHGYQWTVEYTDDAGAPQVFVFDNVRGFESQLQDYARQQMEARAEADLLHAHFTEQEIEKWSLSIGTSGTGAEEAQLKWDSASSPKTGLELKSLTPAILHNEWLLAFEFQAYTDAAGEELAALQARAESYMLDAMAYLEDDALSFELRGDDTEHSYILKGDASSGALAWHLKGDLLDEENTVDGRLMTVRKLYIKDELFVDTDIFWDEETQEYHADVYYVYKALDVLGIAYEAVDSGAGIYTWTIGEDAFEVNKREGTVLKNGKNIIGYEFNATRDINMSVLEEITGTVSRFDQEERAIYLKPR